MNTINNITNAAHRKSLSLHELTDDILKKLSPIQINSKSHIANHVPANLYVHTNENIVASVIDGLLQAVITNAANGEIYITAKELFGNTIKVSVKDNSCYNTYAVACGLQNIVPLAEQIGGDLNIMNQRQKITTIEFSFPVDKEENDHREIDN